MAPWSHSKTEIALGTYEEIALEYYDVRRHPTCANFREATRIALRRFIGRFGSEKQTICEVGAGRSILVEELTRFHLHAEKILLIDSSPSMLKYSERFREKRISRSEGDATQLHLKSRSVEILVSSLGDPYNTPSFWNEAYRILKPGGSIFYSTPSDDWARAFRLQQGDALAAAGFELRDGKLLSVPSLICPVGEQVKLIEKSGLRLEEFQDISIAALKNQVLSPKLIIDRGAKASVVSCYTAVKPFG